MRIRDTAEIIADFPDDQVYEGDEVVLFGGRNVAEAIGAILTELDYSVSPPIHRHENGWDFEVMSEGKRVWMQVSYLGEQDYVLATDFIPKLSLFASKKPIYAEMLERLNKALASDHRFKSVAWVYRGNATGAPTPGPLDP